MTKPKSRKATSGGKNIPPPSKPSKQVREAMVYLCTLTMVELREALIRTKVIYPLMNEVGGGRRGEAAAGATAPGTWATLFKCDRQTIADLKSNHIYRICNNANNNGTVQVYIDGKRSSVTLDPGTCADFEGKKFEVHMIMHSLAKGTYEKID